MEARYSMDGPHYACSHPNMVHPSAWWSPVFLSAGRNWVELLVLPSSSLSSTDICRRQLKTNRFVIQPICNSTICKYNICLVPERCLSSPILVMQSISVTYPRKTLSDRLTRNSWVWRNTAAKRLRMRQVEHFRSLFQSHFQVRSKSPARARLHSVCSLWFSCSASCCLCFWLFCI